VIGRPTPLPAPAAVAAAAAPAGAAGAPARGRSLVGNSLLMMGTTAANLVLGYAFWVVAARLFSVSEVGLAAAVIAAMTLCGTVGAVGVGNALIHLLPTRNDDAAWSRTVAAALVSAAGMSAAVGVVLLAVLPAVSPEFAGLRSGPLVAAAFLAGAAALVAAEMVDRAFVGDRSSGSMLARNAAAAALKIALLAVPAVVAVGAGGIVVAWVLAAAASLPLAVWLQRRLGRRWRRPAGVRREVAGIVRTIAGHHVVSVGNMAPQYLLPLLVAGMLSTAENGVFYTTWRVAGGFMIVSVAVATSLFADGAHDARDLGRKARRALLLIAGMLVPALLVAVAAGDRLLAVLGPEYAAGSTLLLLLALGALPDAVTNVYVALLRLERRFRAAAALTATIAAATVALSVALLEPLGVAGVGVAFLAAQTLGCVLAGADVVRRRRMARPAG
jgi:O-antigen/teichoic acid export membrane protein